MPELAAVFTVGFFLCLALTVVFVLLIRRRRRSLPYVTIQTNLRRAVFYWSENLDKIVKLDPAAKANPTEEQDRNSSERTIAVTGLLLSFLSWAGFFFLLILMLSYRFFARSRVEKSLFASPLATQPNLPREETEATVRDLT